MKQNYALNNEHEQQQIRGKPESEIEAEYGEKLKPFRLHFSWVGRKVSKNETWLEHYPSGYGTFRVESYL